VKRGSAFVGLLLLLSTLLSGAYAQEPTATPSPTPAPTPVDALFQTVVVDQHKFQVDSFYVCQFFLIARVSKLGSSENETAVVTTLTWQPFLRSGNQMIAGATFVSYEDDLTVSVPVGGTLACKPPITTESTQVESPYAGVNP
jgi:hypothetical protein